MNRIIIQNVELSKNPVKVGEAFIIKIKALSMFTELISPQDDLYAGQENCGQPTLHSKLLKP